MLSPAQELGTGLKASPSPQSLRLRLVARQLAEGDSTGREVVVPLIESRANGCRARESLSLTARAGGSYLASGESGLIGTLGTRRKRRVLGVQSLLRVFATFPPPR